MNFNKIIEELETGSGAEFEKKSQRKKELKQ